jgi:hypothetical protein
MGVTCFSETSVDVQWTARCYAPEYIILSSYASQKHRVFVVKFSRLTLLREVTTDCSEKRMKPMNKPCDQSADVLMLKQVIYKGSIVF